MATYKISYAGGFDLELYISGGTQEVSNNRTYVYYRLRLIRTGSRTSNSSYNNPYTVSVNGSQVASGTSTYSLSSSSTIRTLATGNVWVNHNANGSKTVAASGTFRDQGGFLGSGTATRTVSGNTALKTIARASEPTTNISSVAAGSSFTVYTNRAASTFTHTVEVSLGSYKQTFTSVATSRSVTMNSASSLGQMGSVTSRNATVSVKTYSGSTLIGTKSTTISVTVPTGITPTVGTLTATETVSAVSGLALATGAMVQGVSLPNLKVTGSTAGTGSSISSQTLEFDGVTTTNTDYVLSRPIVNSGTLPFKVTTRDARGRSTPKSMNVTVLPYAAPTAVVGSADRSTSTGTVSDTGTYLKVVLSGFVASLRNGTTQRNTLTLRIDSKLRGAADSTYANHVNRAITVSTTEEWSRTETFTRSGGFVQSGSYVLRITVTDKLRSSVVIHNISTGQIALHFDANLGVGIGKYREQGMLDVGGDIHTGGSLYLNGKRYDEVTVLSTENIDNLIVTGEYAQNATANATSARGYPTNVAGLLTVTKPETGSMVYQSYQTYANQAQMFIRTRYMGDWFPWREVGIKGLYGLPFATAAGSYTLGSSDGYPVGTMVSHTVNFPSGRFTVGPFVMVTADNNYASVMVSTTSRNTTSFRLDVRRTVSQSWSSGRVSWFAIQMTMGTNSG